MDSDFAAFPESFPSASSVISGFTVFEDQKRLKHDTASGLVNRLEL